ncbi:unnamed protein product [Paramecium octaurelia]|uniref:Uncharacterized protein n=1 Tax=Paramecium octaurelia TaxID=43137 RepID=A0A8S1W786_PAROT|nr:unnamed protein product [Paramecium octaurelia]
MLCYFMEIQDFPREDKILHMSISHPKKRNTFGILISQRRFLLIRLNMNHTPLKTYLILRQNLRNLGKHLVYWAIMHDGVCLLSVIQQMSHRINQQGIILLNNFLRLKQLSQIIILE